MRADLVQRFAEWGVTICAQPSFAVSDHQLVNDSLEPQFAELSYNWQAMIDSGVDVIFGSDFGIEELSPLRGLQRLATGATIGSTGQVAHSLDTQLAFERMTDEKAGTTTLSAHPLLIEPHELEHVQVITTDPAF